MKLNALEIFKGGAMIILFAIGLYFAYQIKGVLLLLFVAFIINAALRPLVDKLEQRVKSRGIALTFVLLAVFISIAAILYVIFSAIIYQISLIVDTISSRDFQGNIAYVYEHFPLLHSFVSLEELQNYFASFSNNNGNINAGSIFGFILQNISIVTNQGFSIVGRVFGGVVSVFVTVMVSIYMIMNRENIYRGLLRLLPDKYEKKFIPMVENIQSTLGAWLNGQIVLMLLVGAITFVLIWVPGLFLENYRLDDYAVVIALIAAILEALPNLGPFLTLAIALVIGLLTGATFGVLIYIVVSFFLLQQFEGIVIVPTIMKKSIDLHPVLSIAAVIAGFDLAGPLGALLSIPIVAVAQVIVMEVSRTYKHQN